MRYFLLITMLAVFLCPSMLNGSQPVVENEPSLETIAARRLCEEFVRVAHVAAMSNPLDTSAITAAVVLITEASKLSPNDEAVWRAMIEVAQMADRSDLRSYAIEQLLRVAPAESSSQLARLQDAIALTNTVDQRIGVYEQLLADSRSSKLDSRVAARLAFDAAILQRQLGDIEQFARWLAESVALDPSYPEAMSLAAGFFGDESADVHRRAELLASAALSNIRDVTTQVSLAEYLMAYGDYRDARALYEVVLEDDVGNAESISDGLLADIVLSQWADGDAVAALDTLLTRQISLDGVYRRQIRQREPRITPLKLARIHAPILPKLATVRAAIYADQSMDSKAKIAFNQALDSFSVLIKMYESVDQPEIRPLVKLMLQAAWVSVWIGEDAEATRSILDKIEKGVVIPTQEKQKFEGWIAMLQGDLATAETLLSQFKDDPGARIGLAKVYLLQGNDQAAANEYLAIARKQSGTLLGVWARNQLQRIVGEKFNVRKEVEELQSLMVGVLQTINNYVLDPRPPIEMRVYPAKQVFSPYEPMLIHVEIKNNTGVPLTISKHGPIQPLLLLEAFIEVPNVTIDRKPPIIIPIDRELSIGPNRSLHFQTNLRQQWIGGLFNEFPLNGASIHLRSTINFTAQEKTNIKGNTVFVYGVGRLGIRKDTGIFRLNGVRLNDTWLRKAIAQAGDVSTIDDLVSLLLLTYVTSGNVYIKIEKPLIPPATSEEPPPTSDDERIFLKNKAITTILTSFPRLGIHSQSWVIATMSDDPAMESVAGMVKDPDSTIAQLAWIIRLIYNSVPDEALDDQRLLYALDSEDESVRLVATWAYSWIENISNQRAEQQLFGPVR